MNSSRKVSVLVRLRCVLFTAVLAVVVPARGYASQPQEEIPLNVAVQLLSGAYKSSSAAELQPPELRLIVGAIERVAKRYDDEHRPEADVKLDLMRIYELASEQETVQAMTLGEIAKRVLLLSARDDLLNIAKQEERSNAELNAVRQTVRALELKPTKLELLGLEATGQDVPGDEKESDGNVNNDEREADKETLSDAVNNVCKSLGYESRREWMRGVMMASPKPVQVLLTQPANRALLFRLLESELIRKTIDGTIEFLLRGGNLEDINVHDARSFYQIMPIRDSRQYGMSSLGVRYLTASRVLIVIGSHGPDSGGVNFRTGILRSTFDVVADAANEDEAQESHSQP